MPVSCTLDTMTQGHFLNVYTIGSLVTKVPCMKLSIYVAIQPPFNIGVATLKKPTQYLLSTFSHFFK